MEEGEDPSSWLFQQGINAEHVYPQSKGAEETPMKSDMYNIYPCKENVNSSRGNCIFGEIEDTETNTWYYLDTKLSSIPANNIDLYSEKDNETCTFEPRESVKGNIARSVFYFYAIYQQTADNYDNTFFPLQKNILLEWHYADPVDDKESQRNTLIQSYQGNFNPFILDSTLARRAFFMADAVYPEGDKNCYDVMNGIAPSHHQPATTLSFSLNILNDKLIIRYNDIEPANGTVFIYDLNGKQYFQTAFLPQQNIDIKNLNCGVYFVKIITDKGTSGIRKFFVE